MILSARILENVSGVNSFSYANQAAFTEGDTPVIYFQLVDASQDRPEKGFVPSGRRFVPANGALLTVSLGSIDDARKISRLATQPFANDPSIWAFQVLTTDKIRGTVNMNLSLNQGGVLTKGQIQAAVAVQGLDGLSRL